jgi:hypothetical protein
LIYKVVSEVLEGIRVNRNCLGRLVSCSVKQMTKLFRSEAVLSEFVVELLEILAALSLLSSLELLLLEVPELL